MTFADSQADFPQALYQVRQAAQQLRLSGAETQNQALFAMADALESQQEAVLEANTLDLEASLEMAMPEVVIDWLKLTPERFLNTVKMLRRLALLGPPAELGLFSSRLTSTGPTQILPLGVVAFIYEAFPELAIVAAGLCIRTGNALVLKGGNEASQTNQTIAQILGQVLETVNLPSHCVLYLGSHQGDAARTSLLQSSEIDLVIPYGRPSLVRQVVRQAAVPVLPTAIGNCYLYWGPSGSPETVATLVTSSHRGEPEAVNAIEKVLIHSGVGIAAVIQCCRLLREQHFELCADSVLGEEYPELAPVESAWDQPSLRRQVILKRVSSLEAAAEWINHFSSGHADSVVTESYHESQQFMRLVRSATLYINASSQFKRNSPQAAAIALGMTAQPGHRGRVDLFALMGHRHVIQGQL